MSGIEENKTMAVLYEHDSQIGEHNEFKAQGLNFKYSWRDQLATACVINGSGLETTLRSLEGLQVELFESFTENQEYQVSDDGKPVVVGRVQPPKDRSTDWAYSIKLLNSRLSAREVCRIMNHMNVWNYAATQGKPVIIIESSRTVSQQPRRHLPRGSIIDLSGQPLRQLNPNWHCMQGTYAYAVDQFSARRLFNYVVKQGLREPLDYLFRDDLFLIRVAKSNDPLERE